MKEIENFDLTNYNSYRVRAKCKKAFFISDENDLQTLFQSEERPAYILGDGNNTILSKRYYDDHFLIFANAFNSLSVTGNIIEAEAGIDLLTLSEKALEYHLTGMEIFYDIPSSLGGAVVMNAGASGEDIGSLITKVRYFNPQTAEINEISREEMNFEYRNSFFQRNNHLIILKVWLSLSPGEENKIREKMDAVKKARWAKQPRNFPNAGSVFKRPKGYYVGAIIEELGLKGYTVGGAMISKKHAGFIVNFNDASGEDILQIISHVKEKVKETYDLELEVEQRII